VVRYLRLRFVVPPAAADSLIAELWQAGTVGIETGASSFGGNIFDAYFAEPLPEALTGLEDGGRRRCWGWPAEAERVADRDWLEPYRKRAKPFAVGSRLVIDPREPGSSVSAPASDRLLLRIPARAAFGTGSHESTRLAIELLESLALQGLDVLDVGTGTGILSFAALLFGAKRVVGVDTDLQATLLAGLNCHLNGLKPGLVAGSLHALEPERLFDLALVNVLPERIRPDLALLSRLLRPGGRAVFSGILAEDGEGFGEELEQLGFREREQRQESGWLASLMELTGP
jgi:ribosomal protein L11 methyltransferase